MIGPEFQLSPPIHSGREWMEALEQGLENGLDNCWVRLDAKAGILANSVHSIDVINHPSREAFPHSLVTYLDSSSFQSAFYGDTVASFR